MVGKELSLLPLAGTVALVLFLLLFSHSRSPHTSSSTLDSRLSTLPEPWPPDPGPCAEPFVFLLALAGFTLTLGTELFFLRDAFGNRMNTMFKFYYQAWVLFAMSSAYGIYWVSAKLRASKGWVWLGRVWWTALAVFLVAALAYPLAASYSRMDMFRGRPSLDGLAFIKAMDPAEYEAIEWLNKNVEGSPVIIEAAGDSYSDYGRVSAWTGLPTVIGWPGHELQWRGPIKELGERQQDVNQIYTSTDSALVQRLLDKYGASYIYVGRMEKARYGETVSGKFAALMAAAFQNQEVTIYRVRS